MGIKRYELSKTQWAKIAPLLPGKASDPGRSGSDNRLFACWELSLWDEERRTMVRFGDLRPRTV